MLNYLVVKIIYMYYYFRFTIFQTINMTKADFKIAKNKKATKISIFLKKNFREFCSQICFSSFSNRNCDEDQDFAERLKNSKNQPNIVYIVVLLKLPNLTEKEAKCFLITILLKKTFKLFRNLDPLTTDDFFHLCKFKN